MTLSMYWLDFGAAQASPHMQESKTILPIILSDFPIALNKYLSGIQTAYRTFVSTEVFNILQQRFVYAFGRAISTIPMPRP